MNEKHLPTLNPGDSHMESLIAAAIQGHADTREAMRWLVRQLVPATQPAGVTDEQINAAYLAWCKTNGTPESFARAILALRPERVPMTDEQRQSAKRTPREIARSLKESGMACNCDLDRWEPEKATGHSHVCRIHKAAMSAHHGITTQAKKEQE